MDELDRVRRGDVGWRAAKGVISTAGRSVGSRVRVGEQIVREAPFHATVALPSYST